MISNITHPGELYVSPVDLSITMTAALQPLSSFETIKKV